MKAAVLPLLFALGQVPSAVAASQCELDRAQQLMAQQPRPREQIDALLAQCRTLGNSDYRIDLLAGVLARDDGRLKQAAEALARSHAQAPGELSPMLELAVTYEFQQRPDQARRLYLQVLETDPSSRPARLGLARVARQQYLPDEAETLYRGLLAEDPDDREAQTGLAMVALQQRRYDLARERLLPLHADHPDDPELQVGLAELARGWRYRLDLAAGRLDLSEGMVNRQIARFEVAPNARDTFRFGYEGNDRELVSLDPRNRSVLPSNAGRIGWLHRVPGQYFWEVAYEYRQYDDFTDSQRLELNVGHRLGGNVQGFAGVRQEVAASQRDQLWHLGVSVPTSARTYATLIAYYAQPAIGPESIAYIANLTYERDRLQLTGGIGHGDDPDNTIAHVLGVWPLPNRQAITFGVEHRSLGDETEAVLGWRVEWQ